MRRIFWNKKKDPDKNNEWSWENNWEKKKNNEIVLWMKDVIKLYISIFINFFDICFESLEIRRVHKPACE